MDASTKSPIANVYDNQRLHIKRGKGDYVWDINKTRYLDFGAGIAVNALGHANRKLYRAANRQMRNMTHVSNLYTTTPAIELASLIANYRSSIPKQYSAVYFGNSGTEANEAALKFGRLYAKIEKGLGCDKIVGFTDGFHGRTMGSLSVTHNKLYKQNFEPLIPHVITLPYNNVEKLSKAINHSTAAVIIEVIQGEGGLKQIDTQFADKLNSLCEKHNVILIADEIQTGLGRTATMYASEWIGLAPDIITLAKPLAGGLPLSATIITERVNRLLAPGIHGTTFGGGPVTTAVGLEIWKTISSPDFLKEVREKSVYFKERLHTLREKFSAIISVRGEGLLLGIELGSDPVNGRAMAQKALHLCMQKNLLVLRSGPNIVRLAPPLNVNLRHIDQAVDILEQVLPYI